jgi:hypothetical protein
MGPRPAEVLRAQVHEEVHATVELVASTNGHRLPFQRPASAPLRRRLAASAEDSTDEYEEEEPVPITVQARPGAVRQPWRCPQ